MLHPRRGKGHDFFRSLLEFAKEGQASSSKATSTKSYATLSIEGANGEVMSRPAFRGQVNEIHEAMRSLMRGHPSQAEMKIAGDNDANYQLIALAAQSVEKGQQLDAEAPVVQDVLVNKNASRDRPSAEPRLPSAASSAQDHKDQTGRRTLQRTLSSDLTSKKRTEIAGGTQSVWIALGNPSHPGVQDATPASDACLGGAMKSRQSIAGCSVLGYRPNEYAGYGAEANTAAAGPARRKSWNLEIVSTGIEEKRLRSREGLTTQGIERIESETGTAMCSCFMEIWKGRLACRQLNDNLLGDQCRVRFRSRIWQLEV
ncbi:MAG: hypothetical protein Q9183_003942 [Haloplaca sp. 2 TL-2023]